MISKAQPPEGTNKAASELSLFHLLDPDVLADPYPLYRRLRTEHPVFWDPYMHSWVVTRYVDVVRVLREFSSERIRARTTYGHGSFGTESHGQNHVETDVVYGSSRA